MKSIEFNRRDFLKLLGTVPAFMTLEPLSNIDPNTDKNSQHIILMIYDAWTADRVDLFGYERKTMPNLTKFAQKSTVYHDHITAGNFTVPGTASILTGMYPWKHRALSLGAQLPKRHSDKTLFNVISPTYNTIGYSQNINSDMFLVQAGNAVNKHIPYGSYNLLDQVVYDAKIFDNDAYIAYSSFEDGIIKTGKGINGSIFIGMLSRLKDLFQEGRVINAGRSKYQDSIPNADEPYLLSDLVDGFIKELKTLTTPSLIYFHFFPPHQPTEPYKYFYDLFQKDNTTPVFKPNHPLVTNPDNYRNIKQDSLNYDAFLASWDFELGRLYDYFEFSGLRENSHILITSDHGELHERGISGHTVPIHYNSLLHVPLVISSPGQNTRIDIHSTTSSTDVLPTIANIAKIKIPDWVQGNVLPSSSKDEQATRSVYCFDAQNNSANTKIKNYTLSLTKGSERLVKYQYDTYSTFEHYDLHNDPNELNDLYRSDPAKSNLLMEELSSKMEEVTGTDV